MSDILGFEIIDSGIGFNEENFYLLRHLIQHSKQKGRQRDRSFFMACCF